MAFPHLLFFQTFSSPPSLSHLPPTVTPPRDAIIHIWIWFFPKSNVSQGYHFCSFQDLFLQIVQWNPKSSSVLTIYTYSWCFSSRSNVFAWCKCLCPPTLLCGIFKPLLLLFYSHGLRQRRPPEFCPSYFWILWWFFNLIILKAQWAMRI